MPKIGLVAQNGLARGETGYATWLKDRTVRAKEVGAAWMLARVYADSSVASQRHAYDSDFVCIARD